MAHASRFAPLLLLLVLLTGCKTELFRGLQENDANEVVAVLMRSGIPAERADEKGGSMTVSVDQSRFADAVELLRARGLPRKQHATMTDIFKGDGLVASRDEERARYIYAISEGLAGTISQIDGVLSARVHIVMPENDTLRRDPTSSTASVSIGHTPSARVGDMVPQIKMLVANAVPGLAYDKVSVLVWPAAAVEAPQSLDAGAIVPVLGLWVHRDSASAVEIVLACGGALLLAMAGIVGWMFWKGPFRRRLIGSSLALR